MSEIQNRIETIPLNNPDEREIIIVVSNVHRERLKYPGLASKENIEQVGGVCFVRDDIDFYDENSQAFLKILKSQGLLRVGNILLQSKYGYQYPNEKNKKLSERVHKRFHLPYYLHASELRMNAIDRKYNHYLQVCTLLGAKKVSVNIIDEKRSAAQKNWEFNLGNFPIKLGGGSSCDEIIKDYRSRTREMGGSLPNIKEAEEYVEDELLQEDQDIKNLINARKVALKRFSEFTNPTTSESYTVDLFSQVTTSLSLAAQIKIPQYLSSLNASLKKHVKKIEKFTLNVEVFFPNTTGQ
ncbi:hypothetical protein [Coleofasciculus sp. E1-EBD-02]|uniref:hypothetical protein n=1 Tax=Coleofasciculus sp. E1-EBD-02 TaxID=3068481 RepID=UPI00330162B7